jgi:hypothetical protein
MPRPGSHQYDIDRARLRKEENEGILDEKADREANRALQEEQGRQGVVRSERGLGPKSER